MCHLHPKNPFVWPWKIFWSPVEHFFFSLIRPFLAIFEVRIKHSCDHTLEAGPNLMCPSSWALNSDNFPFFWILYCSSRTRVTAVWSLVNICWLKFQQILTDLQTAVTQVPDEQLRIQKKGKSSKFNAQDDGHIKSGPTVEVWSHGGFILTSKIAKNHFMRLKQDVPQDSKNNSQIKRKGF